MLIAFHSLPRGQATQAKLLSFDISFPYCVPTRAVRRLERDG